jgi:hypothetical protein
MDLTVPTEVLLQDMEHYLLALDPERYARSLDILSAASVGQHTRHVLEFFICLTAQQEQGCIDYDARERSMELESNPAYALHQIAELRSRLPQCSLALPLELAMNYQMSETEEASFRIPTTLAREWVYNLEHAIHHLAMIKIGLHVIAPELELRPGFGVAPSTMRHRARTLQG